MATPQESITSVSGKRCTRRPRTTTTSISSAAEILSSAVVPPPVATSAAQPVQSSAAPPPAPPSSSPVAAPVAPSSAAASSPASGTDPPVSSAQPSVLANLAPSPVAAAPIPGALRSESAVEAISVAAVPASSPTTPSSSVSTTSSDAIIPAATSRSPDPTVTAESSVETSSTGQSSAPTPTSIVTSLLASDPPQASNAPVLSSAVPSGNPAGIIAPDQGDNETGLTLPNGPQTNVGGIVGGVVGGFMGIALISVLLFLCLRRRKTKDPFAKWPRVLSEKSEKEDGSFFGDVKEKFQAVPAGVGLFLAKLKGKKSGPAENPYRRHSARSSVSSVYSVRSNVRSRSISEPPSKLRQQLRGFGFGDRMPSLKRSRTLLAKKQDSLVVGSKSPFPGIVEDPVRRDSKPDENPFMDPEPLEPPKNLYVLNPDPSSREGSPRPQQGGFEGLQNQQRAPLAPKPATMSDRGSRDPFASILDQLEERNGSGTPEWLRDPGHKRTQSATTALRSHPPSSFYAPYTPSIYPSDNPFKDPADAPPVPTQPLPPNPPLTRPPNAYAGYPTFNATSSAASRESGASFFGEPGPSRPSTNMFVTPPRAGRQSDPFDLDRPEVLGFGSVTGRREVRASVTRQNSRNKRASSVPNWVNVDDGPYERASAVPGPLRNPSLRR
ncbi:hypothetical protein P154DRAFT_4047 [Amniculicola lignicola CBS 123094]|uniref:Uncharacterized protein n=1 Tax=Amniculicola lignicola CBS 123094 TaxID=1392246 RepID=A0A6A5X4N4_9PLEO|nr:hypothetical protein P154DRAFT_4047 [Amniculicola lignicola CBS 123094]